MKILHVIPSVDMRRGGPSVAVRQITNGLASAGADVTVATTTAGLETAPEFTLREYVMEKDVRYIYFPVQMDRSWMFSLPLARWLFQNVRLFDLVHVHAVFPFPVWPACRASYLAGVPYVVRPAGTLDPYGMGVKSWKKYPYYRWIIKPNLRNAAAIQVTSMQEGRSLAAKGFANTVANIPHGIELPEIREGKREGAGRPLQLLFLSRLHPIKAVPVLFEALNILKSDNTSIHLTVAGEGASEYTTFLEREVDRLELKKIVSFSGYVQGTQKEALYRAADVFMLPSYHENFGIAVTEAMSFGIPVIVSDQVALSTEVQEAQAGLVVPTNDPDALSRAILRLSDDETRLNYGKNARILTKTRFSVDEQIRRLLLLYNQLTTNYEAKRHRSTEEQ